LIQECRHSQGGHGPHTQTSPRTGREARAQASSERQQFEIFDNEVLKASSKLQSLGIKSTGWTSTHEANAGPQGKIARGINSHVLTKLHLFVNLHRSAHLSPKTPDIPSTNKGDPSSPASPHSLIGTPKPEEAILASNFTPLPTYSHLERFKEDLKTMRTPQSVVQNKSNPSHFPNSYVIKVPHDHVTLNPTQNISNG